MPDTNSGAASDSSTDFCEMVAAFHGFEICQEPWRLYYDETGNWRSISYRNGRVRDTRAFERDFILGGIVVTDNAALPELLEGSKKLPAPNGEIKCKSVLGGSKDFWKVLRRQETTDFLSLIDRDGVAVHYHTQDNLYYSTVDIVDSLIAIPIHRASVMFERELKNELYLCALQDPIAFLNELSSFGYPNISRSNVRPFCEFLQWVISFRQSMECPPEEMEGFFLETLRQMVKTASKEESLAFLEGNKDDSLVDDFSSHYTTACAVLPNATHIFDEEPYVSMKLVEPLNNYIFVDSKSEPLVQLADVWVGFLSRLFAFLDDWMRNPFAPDGGHLQSQEIDNLGTAKRLIDRSNNLHRSLISNVSANDTILGRERALRFLCCL